MAAAAIFAADFRYCVGQILAMSPVSERLPDA
jgi:hypothetical protein